MGGKKSKAKRRAGGGGKKKATFASNTAVSTRPKAQSVLTSASQGNLRAVATSSTSTTLALPSSSPSVLRGIISSNDNPGECALCKKPFLPESAKVAFSPCCGKHCCRGCAESGRCTYPDLLGDFRCIFCNVKVSKRDTAEKNEAHLGKAWAQYQYAKTLPKRVATRWFEKSAKQGHPYACLNLAVTFRHEDKGVCHRDLELAKSYAEKAKSLYSGFGLRSNRALYDIAQEYAQEQATEDAIVILTDIANETNTSALDSALCEKAAACLYGLRQHQLAAKLYAKAFFRGVVRSALGVSLCQAYSKKYALSKLWFSIASQMKNQYVACEVADDGSTKKELSWSDDKICRDIIRSALRKNRDSCGECGAALQGDMRKYCRGCKAYCYCSRECQKLHWNRKKNSHRDECKEAKEHWEKAVEAIRSGKVVLSKEKE